MEANKKEELIIYHNTTCSKSREGLQLLNEHGCELQVREYLKEHLSEEELTELLAKLGLKAIDLVRVKEPLFQEKYAGKKMSNKQWIKVLSKNPILIERPIVVYGNKAVIGRPVERILDIMEQSNIEHEKKVK